MYQRRKKEKRNNTKIKRMKKIEIFIRIYLKNKQNWKDCGILLSMLS